MFIDLEKDNELISKFHKLNSVNQINVISHIDFAIIAAKLERQYGLPAAGYETESDPVVSEPARV